MTLVQELQRSGSETQVEVHRRMPRRIQQPVWPPSLHARPGTLSSTNQRILEMDAWKDAPPPLHDLHCLCRSIGLRLRIAVLRFALQWGRKGYEPQTAALEARISAIRQTAPAAQPDSIAGMEDLSTDASCGARPGHGPRRYSPPVLPAYSKDQPGRYTPSTIMVLAMQHLDRSSPSSWYSGELTRVRTCS